jgi:tetratricopeptide (TPR) repeat protein
LFLLVDEVKSHYETLGVTKTAGNEEIKRAYFSLVRKYQPDRFPKEFKEIRAAYETLSDRQKRAEYDAIGELPSSVAPLFYEAQRLDRSGKENKAAELYQMILKSHPDLNSVREQYAKSLSTNNKPGKAVEVWEELCRKVPDNPRYARELSRSYADRGWNKKALTEIRRALTLDRNAIDSWIWLSECIIMGIKKNMDIWGELEQVSLEALEALKEVKTEEWKKIRLYSQVFIACGNKRVDDARACLLQIIRVVRENGRKGREKGHEALQGILMFVPCEGLANLYPELKEIADLLSDMNDTQILNQLDDVRLSFEIEELPKKGFHEIFRDLFRILNAEFEEDYNEIEILSIEYILIERKSEFDPQIRRLKEEFPELYALNYHFFTDALCTCDPDKMMHQRAKAINKVKRKLGIRDKDRDPESEDDVQSTIRRAEPKVGRNDPCPCGSGKKYKRCCGR